MAVVRSDAFKSRMPGKPQGKLVKIAISDNVLLQVSEETARAMGYLDDVETKKRGPSRNKKREPAEEQDD